MKHNQQPDWCLKGIRNQTLLKSKPLHDEQLHNEAGQRQENSMLILLLLVNNMLLQKNQELIKINRLDPMLGCHGVYNRQALDDKLKGLMREEEFCFIFFDVDNFKKINEEYSHSYADQVLHALAETISKIIRKNDLFGRYGGDEFIIIPDLKNPNEKKLAEIIRKITREIKTSLKINLNERTSSLNFRDIDEPEITISITGILVRQNFLPGASEIESTLSTYYTRASNINKMVKDEGKNSFKIGRLTRSSDENNTVVYILEMSKEE